MNFFTFIFHLFSLRFTQHLFLGVYNSCVAVDLEISKRWWGRFTFTFFFLGVYTFGLYVSSLSL